MTSLPFAATPRDRASRFQLRAPSILGGCALALLAAVFPGCASSGPLGLASAPGASLPGEPMLQRVEKTHRVQVRLLTPAYSTRLEELPAFDVSVTNLGAAPLSFGAPDVAVFSGTDTVRIYTASELVDRIQKEADQEAREKASASAEKVLQTRSTNTDPSSAIVKIERDKLMELSAASRATTNARFAELVRSIVPVSISPGGTGGGVIKLHAEDLRRDQPLRIVVTLAGETYEFTYSVARRSLR